MADQNRNDEKKKLSELEVKIQQFDERLKKLDPDIVLEALVGRALLRSRIYRHLRGLALVLAGLVVAVFFAGIGFSTYQMTSIQARAENAARVMHNAEERVTQRSRDFEKVVHEKTTEIFAAAITEIEVATKSAKDKAAVAEKDIEQARTTALERLDVKSLPNISEVKGQIAALDGQLKALAREGDRLNLKSIRAFVDNSIWLVVGASVFAFVFSVFAFVFSLWALKRAW